MSHRLNLICSDLISGDLEAHMAKWDHCTLCSIGRWAPKKAHFRSTMPCQVLMIGEAPGRDEAISGSPFVGDSGRNLDSWISWCRLEWYEENEFPAYGITNTVACRPCDKPYGPNRKPLHLEQANCQGRFRELFDLANPKAIILLGAVAREYWLSLPYKEVNILPYADLPHPSPLRVGGPDSSESRRARQKMLAFLIANFGDTKGLD